MSATSYSPHLLPPSFYPLPPLCSSIKICVKSNFHLTLYLLTPRQPSLLPSFHQSWVVTVAGATMGRCSFLPPPFAPPHLWVPLCLLILLPNRSIIKPLSLVNVASDTSDGSFMHAAGVRRKVGATVEGGGWVMVEGGEMVEGQWIQESCAVLFFFLPLQAGVWGDNCDKELNPFLCVQSFGTVGTGLHSCSRLSPQ